MPDKIDISVIIVNYNVKYFLENTISSVLKSANYPKNKISCEIIVVDNCSHDKSKEYINEKFGDKVDYIYNDENLGFAKANNVGLKKAKGDFLLILNPDTLLQDNTLEVMLSYLKKNKETALATCYVSTPDNKLDTSCHRSFPTAWNSFSHIIGLDKIFKNHFFASYNLSYLSNDEIVEVDAVSGCFMILRREIIDEGIFLPEDYFMYGEDIDFCYQIKKKGYKIEFVPLTSIIHYRGQSSKKDKIRMKNFFYRSMRIFVKKNYSSKYSSVFNMILNIGILFAHLLSLITHFLQSFLLPIIDMFSYVISLIAAIHLYKPVLNFIGLENKINESLITLGMYSKVSFIYIFIILSVFYLSGVYTSKIFSYKNFIKAAFFMIMLTFSATFILNFFAYSRVVLTIMLLISTVLMFAWRLLLLKKIPLFFSNVLIIGIDDISRKLISYPKELAKEGLIIKGYIDVKKGYIGKNIEKYPVFGSIENILDSAKLEKVKYVIFSLKSITLDKIMPYAEKLKENNIKYKILPDFFEFKNGKIVYIELT